MAETKAPCLAGLYDKRPAIPRWLCTGDEDWPACAQLFDCWPSLPRWLCTGDEDWPACAQLFDCWPSLQGRCHGPTVDDLLKWASVRRMLGLVPRAR